LKPKILLIGGGGHSISCVDVIEAGGLYEIAGLIDPNMELQEICDYPVFHTEDILIKNPSIARNALITIGQIKSPELRIKLFRDITALGYKFPTIISPRSYISSRSILGPGTIVMHEALLNANSVVGKNCIINTKAVLEHGVIVGNHCHISTGSVLNGDVAVGEGTFIGSGSVIREGVKIGSDCVIGMGATIKRNIPNGSVLI
jgi:sugar O-acyltransferase (sialic acid O-acetyltransferase NeuD family)